MKVAFVLLVLALIAYGVTSEAGLFKGRRHRRGGCYSQHYSACSSYEAPHVTSTGSCYSPHYEAYPTYTEGYYAAYPSPQYPSGQYPSPYPH